MKAALILITDRRRGDRSHFQEKAGSEECKEDTTNRDHARQKSSQNAAQTGLATISGPSWPSANCVVPRHWCANPRHQFPVVISGQDAPLSSNRYRKCFG